MKTNWLLVLFVLGGILLNSADIGKMLKQLFVFFQTVSVKISKRKKTLAEKIAIINGGDKQNFIEQAYTDMKLTFNSTKNKKGLHLVKILCVVLSVCGMYGAWHFRSYMLIPILGVGLALLPMWVTRLKSYKQSLRLHSELSVTLSSVTSTYLRTENFIKAVEENLPSMKQPLKKAFNEFLVNYNNVDKSIVNGIKVLVKKVKHPVFNEWCTNLIVCQNDKNHLPSLMAILSTLDSEKRLYERLKTEIYTPLTDTIVIISMQLCIFPLLSAFSSDALAVLFNTVLGQILLSGFITTILIALDRAIKYCNPQMRGGDI